MRRALFTSNRMGSVYVTRNPILTILFADFSALTLPSRLCVGGGSLLRSSSSSGSSAPPPPPPAPFTIPDAPLPPMGSMAEEDTPVTALSSSSSSSAAADKRVVAQQIAFACVYATEDAVKTESAAASTSGVEPSSVDGGDVIQAAPDRSEEEGGDSASAPAPAPPPAFLSFATVVQRMSFAAQCIVFQHGRGLNGFIEDFGDVAYLRLTVLDGIYGVLCTNPTAIEAEFPKHSPPGQGTPLALPNSLNAPSSSSLHSSESTGENLEREERAEDAAVLAQLSMILAEAPTRYVAANDLYHQLYSTEAARGAVRYSDFLSFLERYEGRRMWLSRGLVAWKRPDDGTQAPACDASSATTTTSTASNKKSSKGPLTPVRVTTASCANNYGGWGTQQNVPTAADVYEILKYVPLHWGNLGNIAVPADVKKRHVRIASFLQWLRRQPSYFEVRNTAGTIEVRRSVLLHPEEHGMTPESAQEWLQNRIAKGDHNRITAAGVSPLPSSTSTAAPSGGDSGGMSAAAAALFKFAFRVCPTYFAPLELIRKRHTKKTMTTDDLLSCMREHPLQFEEATLHTGDVVVRRRTTASATVGPTTAPWRQEVLDSWNANGEVSTTKGLIAMCNHSSSLWDRPEYLYVRLSDEAKAWVGGYDGMVALLKNHPRLFVMGSQFYCRADPSNPLAEVTEPAETATLLTVRLAEENPYLTPREAAEVLHYVTPEDTTTTVAHYMQASSPAIRSVLPPRIMSLIELFPDLFSWREVQPGLFHIRRKRTVAAPQQQQQQRIGSSYGADDAASSTQHNDGAQAAGSSKNHDNAVEDDDGLFDSGAEHDSLSLKDTVEAVAAVIPTNGLAITQLEQWVSLSVQQSAKEHFGTLLSLLENNQKVFELTRTSDGTRFVKRKVS